VDAIPREVRIYETSDGRTPFTEWMDGLEGLEIYAVIMNRLDRVENGNLGDCYPTGEGVSELRIDVGPGCRIYFGQDGHRIILLGGGTKKTQSNDIKKAKGLWKEYGA
jgi:putative addiction module killer protein